MAWLNGAAKLDGVTRSWSDPIQLHKQMMSDRCPIQKPNGSLSDRLQREGQVSSSKWCTSFIRLSVTNSTQCQVRCWSLFWAIFQAFIIILKMGYYWPLTLFHLTHLSIIYPFCHVNHHSLVLFVLMWSGWELHMKACHLTSLLEPPLTSFSIYCPQFASQ